MRRYKSCVVKSLNAGEQWLNEQPVRLSMTTSYFTFGQAHIHKWTGGQILDKDTVVKITANDPRQKMHELFGDKWSMQYDELPDMSFFPKGIIEL